MNLEERSEIARHCKFVEKIISGTPYTPTKDFLESIGCHFYAHGDDPAYDQNGTNITELLAKQEMLKTFKRTEGISTTNVTSRLLDLCEYNSMNKAEQYQMSMERFIKIPKQTFLATSKRINNFANQNSPIEGDTIVYIQGSFDLLHHGHMRRLELAK